MTFQYPKLADAAGFELIRVLEGSKVLQEIAIPQTIPNLRAVVHHYFVILIIIMFRNVTPPGVIIFGFVVYWQPTNESVFGMWLNGVC